MNSFSILPYEIFEEVLTFALDVSPNPHLIPTISRAWSALSLPLLHSRLRLISAVQLQRFANSSGTLECAAGGRYVEIRLPGGTQSTGVWAIIEKVLMRCEHCDEEGMKCCRGVRSLRLVLNSHLSDPGVYLVGKALGQINPEVFSWSGPDPDHHFSTAIVPTAANELCKAMRSWTSLRILTLSNISFLQDGRELSTALLELHSTRHSHSELPLHVSISKAVFMQPTPVLMIVLGCPSLAELRLVDVYQHSIWGPRLRRKDVEGVLDGEFGLQLSDREKEEGLKIVKMVVKCIAKTERLMGGDRELN